MLADSGFEITDFKEARHNGKPLLQFFVDRVVGAVTPPPGQAAEAALSAKPAAGGRPGGGVTLDDCEFLTEKIGAYLDMNNIIEGGYIIEVSSPGIDRVLRREKDFKKFSGSKVKVKLKKPLDKARVYYGTLAGFENGLVLLSDNLKFSLEDIEEARLNPDDEDIFK